MADLVMGAMPSLIPKLTELLKEEYNLQTGVKERVRSLTLELEHSQAALRKVADVPWDQLDEQVKLWAREVRESSYDMEDVLDSFLVRVQGHDSTEQQSLLKRLGEKMANLIKKSKARREISVGVKDIITHLNEVTKRCRMYKVDDIKARPDIASKVDPRLAALYNKVNNLVGIDKPSCELWSMLQSPQRDDVSNTKMKIVSVFGSGGLGKTTLAKAIYDKCKGDYDCWAFVPVGRNPDLKKVFKDILIDLDRQRYLKISVAVLDERQLIDELRSFFLDHKRYFIVIDDIWEIQSWEKIKLAFDDDNNHGGRIIITTRKLEVARKAGKVYELQPLPYDSSRELFYIRISDDESRSADNQQDEISNEILKRCGGIPLAIISMASLLVGKPKEKWYELYKSIGFGRIDNKEADDTIMRILSFSYYDLPSHLRTCLLYLSAFPEDCVIPKDTLVWKWVAEGFVHEEQGIWLFEIGEGYFNDLINRSLIQAVESAYYDGTIHGCRVHDMVLDFIRSVSREENFFTILDNDQGTLLPRNARRLAQHNRTIGHTHRANNFYDMLKLRSFSAQRCFIDEWVPLSSFTLLRVLTIENCTPTDGRCIRIEHLGHLLHLRFLGVRWTAIHTIPKEIEDLRFLQTLDLWGCNIVETLPNSSLPKQLVCLRIDAEVALLERLTSLEQVSIAFTKNCYRNWPAMELSSLRELRVLRIHLHELLMDSLDNEERVRDLVESTRHLHKLQHLTIQSDSHRPYPIWKAGGLVLPFHLRHLAVYSIKLSKLPACINPCCLSNLSHVDLVLGAVDEQDLKILGGLPELRFLDLTLYCSARISNISDSDVVYFPKLTHCNLVRSMVLFVANKEDKSVSFHVWNGEDHIAMPSGSDDDEVQKSDSDDDKPHRSMPSISDDDEFQSQRSMILQLSWKVQHGLLALAYYLVAFLQLVLAFVNKWSSLIKQVGQHPLISNRGTTPGNGDDGISMPSPASDDENKEGSTYSKVAAAPCFMPRLKMLHFGVHGQALRDDHPYLSSLSLEYLSSLREFKVRMYTQQGLFSPTAQKVEGAMRRVAEKHPNGPAHDIQIRGSFPLAEEVQKRWTKVSANVEGDEAYRIW